MKLVRRLPLSEIEAMTTVELVAFASTMRQLVKVPAAGMLLHGIGLAERFPELATATSTWLGKQGEIAQDNLVRAQAVLAERMGDSS